MLIIHKKTFLNNLFLCLLIAICIFTPLYKWLKMVNIVMILLLWMVSTFSINASWIKKSAVTILCLIGMLVLYLLLGFSSDDMAKYFLAGMNQLPVYVWFLVFQFYIDRPEQLHSCVRVFFALFLVTMTFTLIGNLRYPESSRLLASTLEYYAEERQGYKEQYIGGYDIIYGAAFLLMPLTILAKRRKWVWGIIVFLFATIVVSAYAIAILLSLVMILCGMIKPKHIGKLLTIFLFLLLIVFLLKNAILTITADFARAIGSEMLEKRITSLLTGEYVKEFGNDNNRLTIYYNALLNWLDHPIFGKLFTKNPVYRRAGHATLLEYLNEFGLFALLFYGYLFRVCRITSQCLTGNLKKQYCIYYLLFILFGAIDRYETFIGIGVCVFFVSPALFLLIQSAERRNCCENCLADQQGYTLCECSDGGSIEPRK